MSQSIRLNMKATRSIGSLLLCVLLSGVVVHAQLSPRLEQLRNITFDQISSEQGLLSSSVLAILEDSRGFMWFGTEGGLCRYDGYNVVAYLPNEADPTSIAGHNVTSLLEDSNRRILWVGTDKGLNAYDITTGKFTRFLPDTADPSSLGGLPIYSIHQDRSGSLWIATRWGLNQMVVDSNGRRKFIRYVRDARDTTSLSNDFVVDVSEGDDGAIWVGTDRGLHRFDRLSKKFKRFLYWENRGHSVMKIQKDDNGVLWLATLRGLVRFDTRTSRFTIVKTESPERDSLEARKLLTICEDKQSRLWIAHLFGGLDVLDVETGQILRLFHDPADPKSLCSDHVKCLYVDRRGSIWIGTNDKGISKIESSRNKYVRLINKPGDTNSLSADAVYGLVEDRRGDLWVGTTLGLDRYDRHTGTFIHYVHQPNNSSSLSGNTVWPLIMDNEGAIWAGTDAGLSKIDPATGHITRYYYEPEPPHATGYNTIMAVHQDRAGRIWVGTNVGPHLVNTKEKRFDRSLYFDASQAILEDRAGKTLWAGTYTSGLLKIDVSTREVKRFSHDPHDSTSISESAILGLCEDFSKPNEILWVTTWGGGLNRFDKVIEKFVHFTERDGLADNQIVSIVFDTKGFIWLGTMKGLSRFDPRTKTFRNYDARDGISSGEGNANGLLRTSSGEIVVGTVKGVTIFHPDSLRDNHHIPPVVLTDFRITNKSVIPGAPNSPLTKTITETKELVLSYLDNMISFEFAALDYVMPEKNQYAYKLDNFDKDWIHSGIVRTATYTNLDPGQYIFRVQGSNNDGLWNEEGASLSIIITPPWWKTTWAYLGYIIVTGTILYSIYRIRMHRLELSHQLQIEHLEAEKMHEVDRMKSRFFANISHEFRTPLTLILGPIQKWRDLICPDLSAPASRTRDEQVGVEKSQPKIREGFQPLANTGELHNDLGMAERNAHRLLRLINQLLDLSKLEAGAMKVRATRMNIVPLVKGIAYSFESSAGMRGVALNVAVDQEEIEVYYDKDMLEKILNNLLSNAFKFTPEGGEVVVSIAFRRDVQLNVPTGDGCVEIGVRDTGIGIPSDQLDKVFDRFYQVDASQTREHEGSGIGLALVKELVELHHGTIQVQSETGKGTTFVVRLPLGRNHLKDDEIIDMPTSAEPTPHKVYVADADKPVEDAKVETESVQAKGGKPIILIVEDNADVRAYIKDYLVSAYEVTEARDGVEGIEKALEIIPDLIISDVMMPKKDGYEVCRTLKLDEKTSHIPIILLTAKAASENKIEGLEIGTDDYLIKPFEPKELLARVKNLIGLRRKLRERFSATVPLKPGEIAVSSIDDVFLKKVAAVVERRMGDENFSVEELGQEVAMSRSQLHRKLIALTNQSASDFIRYMRLHRAMDLLKNNAGTVAEVAYRVGYSNPSHFSTRFREQFGLTPGEARTTPDK